MKKSEESIYDKIMVLKDLTNLQCSSGNWDYDRYMHGMANGMILALSILTDKEPIFLERPDEWLSNISIKTRDHKVKEATNG